jgi:hypothetical protein
MNEKVENLIKRGDVLYSGYIDPYKPSARFFKAEQLIQLWPEIRYWLVNSEGD